MICKHDQLYRINNEKSGGAGCPMCNAQRTKRVVMTSVNTAAKQITTVDPDWAAFCKRVYETDCTSQWADRGADHD